LDLKLGVDELERPESDAAAGSVGWLRGRNQIADSEDVHSSSSTQGQKRLCSQVCFALFSRSADIWTLPTGPQTSPLCLYASIEADLTSFASCAWEDKLKSTNRFFHGSG